MATPETIRETMRLSVEELGEHLATLEEELSGGRSIELVRGEKVIAEVRAPKEETERPQMPDFKARLREWYPDGPLDTDMTAVIRADRDGEEIEPQVAGDEMVIAEPAERYMPDFMGRMKEIWGEKVFPAGTGVRLVREDRDGRG